MKICIDCDPGVDDSLAILFALARPDVEVVGISTSVGQCVENLKISRNGA